MKNKETNIIKINYKYIIIEGIYIHTNIFVLKKRNI
jgi:hypothetical protein